MSIKNVLYGFGVLVFLGCQPSYAQSVVPENDNSTAEFVELCRNLNDVDAQNFCFGFGEGVFQTYMADRPKQAQPEFCLPKAAIHARAF
ncbi:hypothetical protein [Polynucleobacter necessarius]|uniref:hypothetical protein n=1 Tax=Polynucleobacter necessarius TaxID=576610 RepID=UPI000E0913C9|nr:hypothetical protein [Polynucleobacter necessarius]